MKHCLAVVLVLGLSATAAPAMACSQISRTQAREMQVRWQNYLSGSRVVTGTYSQLGPAEIDGETPPEELGIIRGRQGRAIASTIRHWANMIVCTSMADYPADGDRGRFYLRREANGLWELVHFERLRSR